MSSQSTYIGAYPSATALTSDQLGSAVVTEDKLAAASVSMAKLTDGAKTSLFRKNAIINGAFDVAQRGTSFTSATTPANSDDTYLLDRWTLLSDGNDIVDVTQNTATVPTGGLFSCALDVETANKKFGIIQFIEQKNCYRAFGGTVSLSFKARKGAGNATVGTMRAVVLAWDGAADSVTSDVVSAWGASGSNPTLAANWTAENTAADLTLTTSFQTFEIEGISVDTASAKNLAVFLYYNNTDGTVGDFIYITDVQLEISSTATEFEYRTFNEELALCQRYYAMSTPQGSRPSAYSIATAPFFVAFSVDLIVGYAPYPVEMRTAPTVTIYGDSSSTPSQVARIGVGNVAINGYNSDTRALARVSSASQFGAANEKFQLNYEASAEL